MSDDYRRWNRSEHRRERKHRKNTEYHLCTFVLYAACINVLCLWWWHECWIFSSRDLSKVKYMQNMWLHLYLGSGFICLTCLLLNNSFILIYFNQSIKLILDEWVGNYWFLRLFYLFYDSNLRFFVFIFWLMK